MKKTFNTTVKEFLEPKKLAVAGASRNEKKFGYIALKELKERGYDLYPVHPEAAEIQGVKCFRTLAEIPADVKHLLSMVPKDQTKGMVEQALDKGITNIWMQQMTETPEAIELALSRNAGLVTRSCILMYATPVKSVHAFHRGIMKIFGLLQN